MNTSDTPQSLAVVNVDKARAVGNVADNFLHEMFTGFRRHYADAADTIRQHLSDGEQKDAQILSHSIVGISGSLGAEQVCAAATELDCALMQDLDGVAVEKAVDELDKSLIRLMAYIEDQYPTHTVV